VEGLVQAGPARKNATPFTVTATWPGGSTSTAIPIVGSATATPIAGPAIGAIAITPCPHARASLADNASPATSAAPAAILPAFMIPSCSGCATRRRSLAAPCDSAFP
jgi:hypothetical protein